MFQRPGLGWDGCGWAVGSAWGRDRVGWRPHLERPSRALGEGVTEPAVLGSGTSFGLGQPGDYCSDRCSQEVSEANNAVCVSFLTRDAGVS